MALRVVVVMGVSGSGKTTIGLRLAARLGFGFYDGDDFHPPENVAKMRNGVPLNDRDRAGWLALLRQRIASARARDEHIVLACSALKAAYRQTLDIDHPDVALVYLRIAPATAYRRVAERRGHFMPPALVVSQFEILEEPEGALVVDAGQAPDVVADDIVKGIAGLVLPIPNG